MALIETFSLLAQNSFFILTGLLGLLFLIGFHELGHFLFCKLFNIYTPSFSIGMGPIIYKKRIGDTDFALSAIPLGGYVEVAGLAELGQGDQQEAFNLGNRSFASKPYWQKFLVMFGGIFFNIIFAFFALWSLYYAGMPKTPHLYPISASTIINAVVPDSPAAKAGLLEHDQITAVNALPTTSAHDIIEFIKAHPNQTSTFHLIRNNAPITLPVAIGQAEGNNQAVGFLGLEFEIPAYGFLDSARMAWVGTKYIIVSTFAAFGGIITGKKLSNLGGPIMVISQTIYGAAAGIKFFLLLLAFISINLAVLNVFPLPILDGGQILYFTIEAIMRKPLPLKAREYIHYATWIFLLILVAYLSVKDVLRIFWKS